MEAPSFSLSKRTINLLIIAAVVLVGIFTLIGIGASANNTAVRQEETIETSKGNISKEEQRRVDLFNNLVDAVQSATTFEQATQTKIAEARSQGNSGNIDQAMLTIQAVAEAYPQIKSIDLYKQTMLEFSITENRLASYREQYNTDVKEYNTTVRSFPRNIVLGIMGYDVRDYKPLDFKVDNSQARNLFDKQ
jgi:LemA protein